MNSVSNGVSKGLARLALILSVAALAISLGIIGPGGTAGPEGPAGPGTLMARDWNTDGSLIETTCTHFDGSEVSITVPGPGTIIVSGQVNVRLDHPSGSQDVALITIASTNDDCTPLVGTAYAKVETSEPMGHYTETVPVMRSLDVSASGTHTFYLNGRMTWDSNGGDDFVDSYMVAVFYPS